MEDRNLPATKNGMNPAILLIVINLVRILLFILSMACTLGAQDDINRTEDARKELEHLRNADAEDASKQLVDMGETILPDLKNYMKNADEATQKKVKEIIKTIERTQEEVKKLIPQLGAPRFKDREVASKRLAEIGQPALPQLKSAAKLKEPEIRTRAESLIEAIDPSIFPCRVVKQIHKRWFSGDFENLEEKAIKTAVQEVFPAHQVRHVYYARTFEVSDHLETDDNEEFKQFKGFGRFGGKQHCLTEAVVKAIEENNGFVFLSLDSMNENHIVEHPSQCLIISLPEAKNKRTFKSYLIVNIKL